MQKLMKSFGKSENVQYLHQKYLEIARYSFDIPVTNLEHFTISEKNILYRAQVISLGRWI